MLSLILALVPPQLPITITTKVDGVDRRAVIYLPTRKTKASPPVLFVFHGHGGSADNFSARFKIHAAWPEAITVYPDGLPITYDNLTRQGWDVTASERNRDIRFFDALYTNILKTYHPNPKQVFAIGHSNGGMFIYTLWGLRPAKFTAFASTEGWLASKVHLTPKPFFITIGSEDEIVAPEVQRRALKEAQRVNQSGIGTPTAKTEPITAAFNRLFTGHIKVRTSSRPTAYRP